MTQLAPDRLHDGEWRVETIHPGGAVSVAIFSGPFAQREAEEYHRWLSGRPTPRKGKPTLRLVRPTLAAETDCQ